MTLIRIIAVAGALALSGCARAEELALARATPLFDVEQFFAGHSAGEATLKIVMRSPQPVRVRSFGHVASDGVLVLDQDVKQGDKPVTHRQWRFSRTASGYAGTLSDAVGPVAASVVGNTLHLQFEMKDGMGAEQFLYLQPDRRTVLNRMTIRKFGITVARLEETIRKTD